MPYHLYLFDFCDHVWAYYCLQLRGERLSLPLLPPPGSISEESFQEVLSWADVD